MKVGDRLYCIKNYARKIVYNGVTYLADFKIGEFYKIYKTWGKSIFWLCIFNNDLKKFIALQFSLDKERDGINYLPEYFITEQESRKLKLEQLNESR